MTTITKKDLVADLSNATGIKHADTLAMVEAFMELVSKNLAEGNEVTLRTFGTFDRCVVRFKPSKELKSRVAALSVQKVNSDESINASHG